MLEEYSRYQLYSSYLYITLDLAYNILRVKVIVLEKQQKKQECCE